MEKQSGLKALPVLIGALLFGMISFAGVAAYLAVTSSGAAKSPTDPMVLLIVLACMGPVELVLYRLAVRPSIVRQAGVAARNGASEAEMEGRFMVATILPAALAEGWGLFGCVILFLTGQWAALVAPVIAAAALATLLDVPGRFDRFKQEAAGMG